MHVVDEFTREALAIECHRRINGDQKVDVLERLVLERGTTPAFVRGDNGTVSRPVADKRPARKDPLGDGR